MGLLARIQSLVVVIGRRGRDRFEDEMADELRFHAEQVTAELVASGMAPEDAARQARMELGSPDTVRADCREARGLRLLDQVGQDVRHAARALRKTPGFAVAALGTLALCLGANLAIFAVVDAVLLRALPFPDPDRLVGVFNSYPRANVLDDGSSITNYYERRGGIEAFSALAIYREGSAVVGELGAAERESVTFVSREFFDTLGVAPMIGRGFGAEVADSAPSSEVTVTGPVTVGYNYWQNQLHGDVSIIGRTLRVDGIPHTVVGVLPPAFTFLSSEARLYLPLVTRPQDRTPQQRHSGSSTRMVARLAPGVSLADAQAQVDAHNAAVEHGGPDAAMMAEAGFRSLVVPLRAHHVAGVRPMLWLLQAGALVLLLIGVVNLVNLFLVRASGRLKEMAVRHALGVSRHRVVSQVLVETTVLTLCGGVLGLGVGAGGIHLLSALGTDRLPMAAHVMFDARLALVALAGAVLVGLAIGAPIAWYHLRSHTQIAAQFEGRGSVGSRTAQRLRHGFAVAQTALALVLLSAAGVLGLSLEHTMAVRPGFTPERVSSGRVSLPRASYPTGAAMLNVTDRLLEALAREPGVTAAGIGTNVPFSGITIKSATTVPGFARPANASPRGHYAYAVTGDYFSALGIPLREGRFLDAADSRRAEKTCVVDEDFARLYWPGRSPLGQHVYLGSSPSPADMPCAVVGVVGGVKQAGLIEDDAPGAIFLPYIHNTDREVFAVVRSRGPAEPMAARLPHLVRAVDADMAMSDVRTMQVRIETHLVARRAPALLAALFSSIAVLLTAVGIYGLFSVAVSQRRREIGVRMALGAQPGHVRNDFLRMAFSLLVTGGVLGLAGVWIVGRAMQAVLYQVTALDPFVLTGAVAVLAIVSLVACGVPSWRASRISPMEALNDG